MLVKIKQMRRPLSHLLAPFLTGRDRTFQSSTISYIFRHNGKVYQRQDGRVHQRCVLLDEMGQVYQRQDGRVYQWWNISDKMGTYGLSINSCFLRYACLRTRQATQGSRPNNIDPLPSEGTACWWRRGWLNTVDGCGCPALINTRQVNISI